MDSKYFLSEKQQEEIKKRIREGDKFNMDVSYAIDANYYKGSGVNSFLDKNRRQLVIAPLTEVRTDEAKEIRRKFQKEQGRDYCPRRSKAIALRNDGSISALTSNPSVEQLLLVHDYSKRDKNDRT